MICETTENGQGRNQEAIAGIGVTPYLGFRGSNGTTVGVLTLLLAPSRNVYIGNLSLERVWSITAAFLFLALSLHLMVSQSYAAPIQRVRGVIMEVGEGYLILEPDDHSGPRKFMLRWKARFIPPKLPLKGDHVLILYKDKERGPVIYGVNYLEASRDNRNDKDVKGAE